MRDKKNILFIAPVFFGYYEEIIKEMEKLNCDVDFYADASNNSNIFKALSRINKNFVKIPMHFYFKKKILSSVGNKEYDCVFMIAAMSCSFTPKMIKKLKELNPKARFIMYQWDGENNIKFIKRFHKFFDKVFTFDRKDYLRNDNYEFLPLFYTDIYQKISKTKNNFKLDISYVGTAHPKKIYWINEMAAKLKKIFPKQYIYHYIPSKLKFYYHKLLSKEYKNISLKDLHTQKVAKNELMKIFEQSKCILDAPQDGQDGLTIRTIECLGAKRKLITVNEDIKNYDFYCEENIYIFDNSKEVDKNSNFFTKPYKELDKEIYEKYSLKNWTKHILKEVLEVE